MVFDYFIDVVDNHVVTADGVKEIEDCDWYLQYFRCKKCRRRICVAVPKGGIDMAVVLYCKKWISMMYTQEDCNVAS